MQNGCSIAVAKIILDVEDGLTPLPCPPPNVSPPLLDPFNLDGRAHCTRCLIEFMTRSLSKNVDEHILDILRY